MAVTHIDNHDGSLCCETHKHSQPGGEKEDKSEGKGENERESQSLL